MIDDFSLQRIFSFFVQISSEMKIFDLFFTRRFIWNHSVESESEM